MSTNCTLHLMMPSSSKDSTADVPAPRWVTVNASAVRVENCVQFGGPWLALELIKKLKLDEFIRTHLAVLRRQTSIGRA